MYSPFLFYFPEDGHISFPVMQKPNSGLGCLIVEVSRSHTHTHTHTQ
jgi:hypothetical protein